jgi:hypothetical protein
MRPRLSVSNLLLVLLVPAGAAFAGPAPRTVSAWDTNVAATEARIARELASPRGFLVTDFSPAAASTRTCVVGGEIAISEMTTRDRTGGGIAVPDGMIAHWRGSVFLPGVTLDALLDRLQHPSERGPHQQDVLALRVLEREPNQLRLFIRMTRSKIVTVTYDTEHRVDYRRHSRTRASSRSVATRIVELDGAGTASEREKGPGENRGFLWRLNSYWRYEQVAGGVIVELESLTLSRSVPFGLQVVVDPIIDRVARESIGRTLENLRQIHAPAASARKERVS